MNGDDDEPIRLEKVKHRRRYSDTIDTRASKRSVYAALGILLTALAAGVPVLITTLQGLASSIAQSRSNADTAKQAATQADEEIGQLRKEVDDLQKKLVANQVEIAVLRATCAPDDEDEKPPPRRGGRR